MNLKLKARRCSHEAAAWRMTLGHFCINIQKCGRKWIFMQSTYFTFVNIISSRFLTICKQITAVCLQFSKLILLICKTLGFTSWNPWFRTLKPLVLQRETHAFRLWFHAYQETLPFCIFMQWNEYLCKRLGRLLNGLANHSTWGRAGPGGSAPTRTRCYIVRWKQGIKKKMKK